jgi:glutamine synthetase
MVEKEEKSAAKAMAELRQNGIRFVYLQFSDVLGIVKSVAIPLDQFADCIERGKWFDGSSVEGQGRVLESDMYLKPDLRTLGILPWEDDGQPAARVICWIHTPDGQLFAGDPRSALSRVLDEVGAAGYRYCVAPELEFYIYKQLTAGCMEPMPQDSGGYFDLSTGLSASVRKEMVWRLQEMGIRVETSHHELGTGQHEIDFTREDAMVCADNLITARYTLKTIAQKHGLGVTFMPKPSPTMEGSGLHVHQSLFHLSGGNAFSEAGNEYGLSEVAQQFIAGLLHHAKGMSLVLNPLVNSYKRLVRGFEAPVYITWARINRSSLIRVPQVNPQKLDTTRLEIRNPDPTCNPYLAFAVMLKCGLHGIQEKLQLPAPVEENLFAADVARLERRRIVALPETLGQAILEFENDEVVREAVGDMMSSKLIEAKSREWFDFCRHVTPWEIERYLGSW